MAEFLAARLEHPRFLVDHPSLADEVGEVLTRPCFAALRQTSMHRGDRWVEPTATTRAVITAYLTEPASEGIELESGGRASIAAYATVPNGVHARSWASSPTRLLSYVVIPYAVDDLVAVVHGIQDLARILDARSGAITLEPSLGLGQRWALASKPTPRPGLSTRRLHERQAHRMLEDQRATRIAGPEWGTFLGPGHVAAMSRATLLEARPACVIDVTPTLVYVQVTPDLADEGSGVLEQRLDALRVALAPILMDLSRVAWPPPRQR